MEHKKNTAPESKGDEDLVRLGVLADLLDNQFRIPGTNLRFGLDGLIGLIPYLGDVAGFAISGIMFSVMLKRGAGMGILLQMMGNFIVDAVIGAIPLLGDLFDFGFKANRRNVALLKRYYASDAPKPKLQTSVLILIGLFFLFTILVVWATVRLLAAIWHMVAGWLS